MRRDLISVQQRYVFWRLCDWQTSNGWLRINIFLLGPISYPFWFLHDANVSWSRFRASQRRLWRLVGGVLRCLRSVVGFFFTFLWAFLEHLVGFLAVMHQETSCRPHEEAKTHAMMSRRHRLSDIWEFPQLIFKRSLHNWVSDDAKESWTRFRSS